MYGGIDNNCDTQIDDNDNDLSPQSRTTFI